MISKLCAARIIGELQALKAVRYTTTERAIIRSAQQAIAVEAGETTGDYSKLYHEQVEINAINKALIIRDYEPRRPAFYHPEKGWLAFKSDIDEGANEPYIPLGKRAALEAILAAGGFEDFDTIVFIKDFKEA